MNRIFGTFGRRQTRVRSAVATLMILGSLLAVFLVAGGRPTDDARPPTGTTLVASTDLSSRCPSVPLKSVLDGSDLAVSGLVVETTAREVVLQIDHVYRGDPRLVTLTISRGGGAANSLRASSGLDKGRTGTRSGCSRGGDRVRGRGDGPLEPGDG